MTARSIVVVGGPDSGKTNFIGRLWRALEMRAGAYESAAVPENIEFVLDTAEHLLQGHFAPRSQREAGRRDFQIAVKPRGGTAQTSIVIPDIHGELWRTAVLQSELSPDWMSELQRADGAFLFVRIQSELNVRPLDWVNSKRLIAKLGEDPKRNELPTQVMLCELLRFLELKLAPRADGSAPRVALMVSAWDLVDHETAVAGPEGYLRREYPLLSGRIDDIDGLDVRVFGVSVVGGDLQADQGYRESFLETGLDGNGWVAIQDLATGKWKREPDLTLPIAWVVGD